MSDPSDLKAFELSRERGFLPEHDPARALPAELRPWDDLAADLPKLMAAGRVREALRALPVLDPRPLSGEATLRRAMLLLSYFGHAFVWGGAEPERVIPAAVAVPWCAVAARLGRPPVLSYASYALDNWRRLDPAGPLELGNLAILQNFLGGADEDWFILVHLEIEARAARVLRELGPAYAAATAGDAPGLGARLEAIAAGIESLCQSLHRMPELCDPYVYYRRVRPYIHGWKDHPSLPEGVVYEGVRELGGRPQRFRGETGAQSGIVPALDAALGVTHAEDPLRAYLAEMRDYMPRGHREFLGALEATAPVRGAVLAASDPDLRAAYDECLRWLESFRSTHLDYAARYIHQQRPSGAANPTAVGTGGTPFMAYLRKHRDETSRHRAV
jgi:indoleamine 2,3-dioxygenase